ncbi:galectin-9-like, partial [Contarinia nasturtii]|uniref:galectin-9-like n=1 Tax=Contarinia nasturtii TaxID=265458 RepID=UPI0012D47E2F
ELPVVHSIPGNISNGSKIEIVGQMLRPYINYFRISLSDSSNRNEHDIIFHLSVRFDKNVIVRNTSENGIWSEEERYGGCPIQRGDEFKMVILVEQDVFEVISFLIFIGSIS